MLTRIVCLPLLLIIAFISTSEGRKRPHLICQHGHAEEGRCVCDEDYVGRHCERKKMCNSFRRYRNGSCAGCVDGYTGEFCSEINCVHGAPDYTGTKCVCDKPWSGSFCHSLTTNDVYSYYNRRVYFLGPLGALSLIPMCLVLFCCEKFAHKRQVKRVQAQMESLNNGKDLNIKSETLSYLLKEDA